MLILINAETQLKQCKVLFNNSSHSSRENVENIAEKMRLPILSFQQGACAFESCMTDRGELDEAFPIWLWLHLLHYSFHTMLEQKKNVVMCIRIAGFPMAASEGSLYSSGNGEETSCSTPVPIEWLPIVERR